MMCRDSNEWGIPSLPKYLHCKTPCCKNGQFLSCFCGGIVCCSGPCQQEVGLQYFLSQKYTKVSQKCHCFLVLAEWVNGPKELSAFFKRWHLERWESADVFRGTGRNEENHQGGGTDSADELEHGGWCWLLELLDMFASRITQYTHVYIYI